MEDYIKTKPEDIKHLLPLKTWEPVQSGGRLAGMCPSPDTEYGSTGETTNALLDTVRELVHRVENQHVLIKYLMDHIKYEGKELEL